MFFNQTFDLLDPARIGLLAVLEILLSADNAIVLGLLVRRLHEKQRRKALFIGLLSSFTIRGASLFAITLLMRAAWIQVLGGAYLLYLAFSHTYKNRKTTHIAIPEAAGFWKTVFLIELYDLAFAIDSVMVAAAFINNIPFIGTIHPKLWIVFSGTFIGMIAVRYAAQLFSSLIEKFPRMEKAAFFMIGWIGIKMILNALHSYRIITGSFPAIIESIFWVVLTLLFLLGFTKRKKHG